MTLRCPGPAKTCKACRLSWAKERRWAFRGPRAASGKPCARPIKLCAPFAKTGSKAKAMTTTDHESHVLEARGGRRVAERFDDDRLRNLWRAVWRQLPAADVDRVYAALGTAGALLVTDHNKANRPSNGYGQVARVFDGLRLFLDSFNLDEVSA